jgi:hypothetical protein
MADKANYSLRLVNEDYSGPIISIQNHINNLIVNFKCDNFGNLSTCNNPNIYSDGIPIEAILQGYPAYVCKWWYQSGNGWHLIQENIEHQPIYDTTTKCLIFNGNQYLAVRNGILNKGCQQYNYEIEFDTNDNTEIAIYTLCEHNSRTITPNQRAALCVDLGYVGFKGAYNDAISDYLIDRNRNIIKMYVDNSKQMNITLIINDSDPIIMNSAYSSQDNTGFRELYLNNYWFGIGMNMSTLQTEGFNGIIYSVSVN